MDKGWYFPLTQCNIWEYITIARRQKDFREVIGSPVKMLLSTCIIVVCANLTNGSIVPRSALSKQYNKARLDRIQGTAYAVGITGAPQSFLLPLNLHIKCTVTYSSVRLGNLENSVSTQRTTPHASRTSRGGQATYAVIKQCSLSAIFIDKRSFAESKMDGGTGIPHRQKTKVG